jgi:methyltransferase
MDVSAGVGLFLFLALLVAVGVARLLEMRLSRRHQRALARAGKLVEPEPGFPLMVALHTAILVGAAVEVVVGHRPFIPAIGIPAGVLFLAANGLRWWVIRTMAGHWNVRVVDSVPLGVVSTGPFTWVRHPNYVAVFVELVALPLIHGAYLTALLGAIAHVLVLAKRIALEERVLMASPAYCAAMGGKPRFVPRPFAHPLDSSPGGAVGARGTRGGRAQPP